MSIGNIIKVTINRQTATVSRAGFGTPLILAFFSASHFSDRAKVLTSLEGLAGYGFGPDHLVYRAAKALVDQKQRVERFVIGRRELGVTRRMVLTPAEPVLPLTRYRVTVNDQAADYTTDSTPTVAEVTAGLTSAINGLKPAAWVTGTPYVVGARARNVGNIYKCVSAGVSGASGPTGTRNDVSDGGVEWSYVGPTVTATDTGPGTSVTMLQDTAGAPYGLSVERIDLIGQAETTTNPGISEDLYQVRTAIGGNDDWYMVVTDGHSPNEISDLASAIESLPRQYMASNADTAAANGDPGNIIASLNTTSITRSSLLWHHATATAPDAAFAGRCLPLDPGSETWKFKTLAGIEPSPLTEDQAIAICGNKGNAYTRVGSTNITYEGTTASGDFIDAVRFIDALSARVKENVFSLFVNVDKVPFTPGGVAQIEAQVREALLWGEGTGGLVDTYVDPPEIDDISPNDRLERIMRPFRFGGRLTGAVHSIEFEVTLTV